MRIARLTRIGRDHAVHAMSRIVGGQRLLDEVCREKLTSLLWRQARFCGLSIVTFCVMPNHFHVLLRVPAKQPELTDSELLERVRALYGRRGPWVKLVQEGIQERGRIDASVRERLLARMGSVSGFMKEVKQRFSRWYNRRTERFGTLWAERFKSVLVEDQPGSLEVVAAYVDLNPVRAGLVDDPKDYRWSGYGAALGGHTLARQGLMSFGAEKSWEERAAAYRVRLYLGAVTAGRAGKRLMGREEALEVARKGGKLSVGQLMMLRVRYFSDGVAIGSEAFVEEVFAEHREEFGPKRKTGARPIRALAERGLCALRDLRVNVFG